MSPPAALNPAPVSWDQHRPLLVLLLALTIHLLPLALLKLPVLRLPQPAPSEEMAVAFEGDLPEAAASAPAAAQPVPAPATPPTPPPSAALSQPQPQPRARPEPKEPLEPPAEPKQPPPQDQPMPLQGSAAKPEPPEGGAASSKPRFAADAGKPLEKAPENPQFLGATNTQAADRGPKDLPEGLPYSPGESGEIAQLARRGETGEDPQRIDDPLLGSVARQGTPEVGRPRKPNGAFEGEEAPKIGTRAVTRQESPQAAPQAVLTPLPPGGRERDPVSGPKSAGQPIPAGAAGAAKDKVPGSEGPPVEERPKEPLPGAGEPSPTDLGASAAPQDSKEIASLEPEPRNMAEHAPRSQPVPPPAFPSKPADPELARLNAILNGSAGSPGALDNTLPQPGKAGREGREGHEGDGRVRRGRLEGLSDVLTANLETSARATGDPAFAKRADPEAAYLNRYLQRIDTKWKVFLVARKMRFEIGVVAVTITIAKDGKLESIYARKDGGEVGDESIAICREAANEAGPLAPFPPDLAVKERIQITVRFLYR